MAAKPFFLQYGNLVFENSPVKKLRRAFHESYQNIIEDKLFTSGLVALDIFHLFLKKIGPENVDEFIESRPKNVFALPPAIDPGNALAQIAADAQPDPYERFKTEFERIALDAAYGYRDKYCENHCKERRFRAALFAATKGRRPLCHECDNLFFVWLLMEMISGKDFDRIIGFESFIAHGDCLRERLRISGRSATKKLMFAPPDPIKECFKSNAFYSPWLTYSERRFTDLRDFITACVSFSLIKFLTDKESNVTWLKICENCLHFFIAKDPRRKHCKTPDCKRLYHKEDMKKRRTEDPGRYC